TIRKLALAYPVFSEELGFAYAHIRRDPQSSLTKSRMVMEGVLVSMYRSQMGCEPRKPLLNELLSDNQFTRRIERRILSRMASSRDMGNLGAHPRPEVGPVDPDDAERVLRDLCAVLEWLRDRHHDCTEPGPGANGQGNSHTDPDSVPPELAERERLAAG